MSQLRALLPLPAVPPAVGVVSPDSSSSDSLYPAGSPEVMYRSPRTTRCAFRRRRPVRDMEPPVENIPVLMIQDPLAAAGAVVLDCRPPLLPVSMDISGVDLSPIRGPAVLADVDVLPAPSGVDMELAHVFLEVGVLPAMVTPVGEPEGESAMTPATYPVPPIPELSVVVSDPLEAASPAGPAVGSPARDESLLAQFSPSGSVVQAFSSPRSPVLRSTPDDSPPSGLAAMDQDSPWTTSLQVGESTDSPLLPAPLTPRRMIAQFASGSGVSSPTGETDVTGGHPRMLDLSREGPFDVLQDRPDSGVSPRVLDGVRGCQYRMTLYDEESGGPDFTPAYGIQLHCWNMWVHRSRLDYSAIVRNIGSITWVMKRRLLAALKLQHDAGLILSNVQVLQQFVTALNSTSSEVMRVAFGLRSFPADAMQHVVPSYRVRRAAHYMTAMGLWRPPHTQGIRGPMPCMSCNDCFPDLPQ